MMWKDLLLFEILVIKVILYLVIFYFIIGCNVNCKNNICDVLNSCIEGCKDGYWGFICILNCLILCFWKVC